MEKNFNNRIKSFSIDEAVNHIIIIEDGLSTISSGKGLDDQIMAYDITSASEIWSTTTNAADYEWRIKSYIILFRISKTNL